MSRLLRSAMAMYISIFAVSRYGSDRSRYVSKSSVSNGRASAKRLSSNNALP